MPSIEWKPRIIRDDRTRGSAHGAPIAAPPYIQYRRDDARPIPRIPAARVRPWSRSSFRHLLLPAAVMLALLALFFSGNPFLASLVVPEVNRELGLLEHLQLLPLAAILLLAHAARRAESDRLWRGAFAVMMLGSLFLFLEEL